MIVHQNGSLLQRSIRHATYVNFPRPDDCSYLHMLPVEEQCEFVETTEACAESEYYFNYVGYLYCTIGSDSEYLFNLGFVLLLCICVYYFVILGTTADKFFCPTLAAIAKALNISEALAGVTILAFGNGSPDLFTAVANPDADTELMFSELLGSAAFVIGVIGGTVLLIQPFDFPPWGISRDLAFFIAAIVWITLKAADERFNLYDSAILIGMYFLFLALVIWEFIQERQEQQRSQSTSAFIMIGKVYIFVWVVVIAVPLMVVIYYTSRTDRCPRYHKLFTLLSFFGCIQVIYVVAQEVVSVLETVGIVLKLSKSVLGLSLLAWGNSVGDLFSNVALARQGYGKMAFAACFGGPLLNLCLGLGLTLMTKAFGVQNLIADVRKGVMGENCEVYLFQILTTTWLCLLFTNFQGRPSVGLAMIVTYLMFLAFSFLGEFELIHPYGTDHHPDPNGA
uniref:Sodium/calcium exchanger membrane region domain-containing protein n=1 Tax=Anopheles culicifacies TaxID=139723 RepID=A0A182LX58_9DIPT